MEECITLSEQGIRVLSDLFQKFDRNGDGLLSRVDIDEAFSITADNPFEKLSKADYMEMCETKKQMMTLNGWISLWCLLTIRDPYTLLRTLVYWGIKRNLEKVLVVKKYVDTGPMMCPTFVDQFLANLHNISWPQKERT